MRILYLEDDPNDARLVQATLEAEGLNCELNRVDTQAQFCASLERDGCDLILADYTLPSFDGITALKLAKKLRPEAPFIFVSGTLDEEVAIEALKLGATDYVFKTRLSRVAPAVRRAVREAETQVQRKLAEQALLCSEQRLRDVIETIPAMVWTGLPDGSNDFANQQWSEYTGLAGKDTSGAGWKAAIHPADLAAHVEKWRESLATGKVFESEARLRRAANGEYRWFLNRAVPLHDEQGNIVKWYGTSTDIEDRKRAEESGRRSEFYLQEAERLAHAGSWGFDPAGFFNYWSRELSHVYGLDPTKPAPTLEEYLVCVHPQDREFMRSLIARMIADASGCDVTKRIVRPSGEVRYIRCVGVPVVDNGVLKGFLGTAMDVTEQEELTQELQRRQAYLAEAQRLSQTGSWAFSIERDIKYWSEECFRVLGFDPHGPLPRFEEFILRLHPDDQTSFRELYAKAIRDKQGFETDYRLVHPDKGLRDIHVISHAVLSPSGDLIEFVGTVIDVTERKRAEEELQQLVDFVPQVSIVMGPDGKYIHANRVAQEYTGLTLDEYRSIDVLGRIIHPDDVERMRRVRGLSANVPFEAEARMLGKDGVYRWFLYRYNPLLEQGRARRWYISATEIESRKQQEERIRKENVRLEERTRIAQELHDTLLQTFLSASMQLGVAVDGVAEESPVKSRLDRILQIMQRGIEEGRNTIQGLRSSDPRAMDLVIALSSVQQELSVRPDIDFHVSVVGRQRALSETIRLEIYRIGREALLNAFCHSGAKRVECELEYADQNLQIRIRDDGTGIDPHVLHNGREGHWGLAGMRERAARVGAQLEISSSTAGTEILLSIPSGTAFQSSAARKSA